MIRPIIRGPDPRLQQVSEPFIPNDPEHMAAAADLADTMRDTPRAIGLAGVQIGHMLRIFAMRAPSIGHGGVAIIANPIITESGGINASSIEECMSFPWLKVRVSRPAIGRLAWQNVHGEPNDRAFSGIEWRCILHEIDHLNGITIGMLRRRA